MRIGKKNRSEPSERITRLEAVPTEATPWRLPWPVMTILAALGTAAASWLLVTGFCVLGWISVPQIKVLSVLKLGTQGWLLAHGISVALPGARLSIMPLGLTLCVIALGLGACQQAVIHSRPPVPGLVGVRVVRMGLVFGLVHLVLIGVARRWTEGDQATLSSLPGAVVLVFGLGLAASARAVGWRPTWLPAWVRFAGLSVLAAFSVMVATGAAVFVTTLIQNRERVAMIHDALKPGTLGGVMLLLGQLAWLPNFVLWCAAWAIGAGVQLGIDTVISPAQTLIGMLPSIPVLGAVPTAGAMPKTSLVWLVSGVLAGVAAAYVMVGSLQREERVRGHHLGIDVTAIVGALIGIACGLAFTLLLVPAGGDLGNIRLVGLGARMRTLVIIAPASMGLAAMVTGTVMGWWSDRSKPTAPDARAHPEEVDEAAIPTSVVATRQSLVAADE